ncbi:MAG: hypothetical protein OEU26_29145 [Candidatus Tectomicrobia bacterium]|nr:hypothetical protein [Candidatus Tectomicrobia bacterium]
MTGQSETQVQIEPGGIRRWLTSIHHGLFVICLLGSGSGVWALVTDMELVHTLHEPQAEHITQEALNTIADPKERFITAFEVGDELFETVFNALDGVGAHVGAGLRFTRIPRMDLSSLGEWATHQPLRPTGPNAQACDVCHRLPVGTAAGPAETNVLRDPLRTGDLSQMITRNTPHLFASGAIQRLAEEMTTQLQIIRDQAIADTCTTREQTTRELLAKGVRFGRITVMAPDRQEECVPELDTSELDGVDADLIVKPFQWKGSDRTIRDFNRNAAHHEIGMQAVELVGDEVDGDFDGVVQELTVGDITALTIYVAGQPRPVTQIELAQLGLIELSQEAAATINRGERVFDQIGCTNCHRSRLLLDDPIFHEPSQQPAYRDSVFPGGQDPIARGVDPSHPVSFDLTQDPPDNTFFTISGEEVRLAALKRNDQGRAMVELYGDLKRHDMGPGLAEPVDEVGTGDAVFLTENLWGVGSTAPYLHDGRATTLTEAILEHGGEAAPTKEVFVNLEIPDQEALIAFLKNLVLIKVGEE